MKNKIILTVLLCAICVFVLAACDSQDELLPAEEAYAAFGEKIANTAALSAYDVTMTRTVGQEQQVIRYVLSTNALGEPVALKETQGQTEYYLRGVRYFSDNGSLRKEAVSLDGFMDVTEKDFVPDDGRIGNIESLKNGVAFDYASADFDRLRITAYFEGAFIKSIGADATYTDNGEIFSLSVRYEYANPGRQPEINLPDNLDEYGWL